MAGVPVELLPFLVGSYDPVSGEQAMRCPHPDHEDNKRSASLNVDQGVWFCFGCDEGGPVDKLARQISDGKWSKANQKEKSKDVPQDEDDKLNIEDVVRWHDFLMSRRFRNERIWLRDARGIRKSSVRRFTIGYDPLGGVYTIPIFDEHGDLVNVRKYDKNPKPDFPKMYSIKGHGVPTIFPIEVLLEGPSEVGVVEGEWDAILTNQNGFACVTRTGAADVWNPEWTPMFEGLDTWLCHDMDEKGQRANSVVRTEIVGVANTVKIVQLPYEYEEKHGKDLGDFWMDGNAASDFYRLLDESGEGPRFDFTVLDSLDGDRLGRPGRLEVRVAGVGNRSFLVPNEILARCGQSYGDECDTCAMQLANGEHTFYVPASANSTLRILYGGAKAERQTMVKESPASFDCPDLGFVTLSSHTVQKLFVTQALDQTTVDEVYGDEAQHFNTMRQVHAVGVHDALSNTTLEMTGSMQINPKDHGNEFVAWGIRKVETSIDKFTMTDELASNLSEMFSASDGEVGKKLALIADDQAEHVTRIYGRRVMHIMMDLVFHSVLRFQMGREDVRKGWLDAIVVGETRTGKSEAATRLVQNYRNGAVISCESASLAGVLGGVQQLGSNEWVITWGVIPFNDQRLVVLDEVSGLTPDEIGSLSSLRSSGVAELTKIKSEKALARTRLIWIGNPRNPTAHYNTGMHMLEDLIPKPEDLARFDIAMSVHAGEPGTERANEYRAKPKPRILDDDLLRELLIWSWSRRTEDVLLSSDTVEALYESAKSLGKLYMERPPLIQSANARMKIARVATAIAARTFSTDDGNRLLVRPDHVQVAVKFIRALYDNERFGYGDESKFERERIKKSVVHWEDAKIMLMDNRSLSMFLRGANERFNMLELRNSAQYADISLAIADAGTLYQWGFLDNAGNDFRINRQMIELLKGIPR